MGRILAQKHAIDVVVKLPIIRVPTDIAFHAHVSATPASGACHCPPHGAHILAARRRVEAAFIIYPSVVNHHPRAVRHHPRCWRRRCRWCWRWRCRWCWRWLCRWCWWWRCWRRRRCRWCTSTEPETVGDNRNNDQRHHLVRDAESVHSDEHRESSDTQARPEAHNKLNSEAALAGCPCVSSNLSQNC